MDSFLLDTNAVLDFLKGEEKITTVFQTEMKAKPRFVSEITRMECFVLNCSTHNK